MSDHAPHPPATLAEVIERYELLVATADCPSCKADHEQMVKWLRAAEKPKRVRKRVAEPTLPPSRCQCGAVEVKLPLEPVAENGVVHRSYHCDSPTADTVPPGARLTTILSAEDFQKVLDHIETPREPAQALVDLLAGRPTGVEEPEGGVFAHSFAEPHPCACGKVMLPGGEWFYVQEGTPTHRPSPHACDEDYLCPVCGTTDPIQHWYHPPEPGQES